LKARHGELPGAGRLTSLNSQLSTLNKGLQAEESLESGVRGLEPLQSKNGELPGAGRLTSLNSQLSTLNKGLQAGGCRLKAVGWRLSRLQGS
jgi:hypothetical protein